jgi:hypothetical protein
MIENKDMMVWQAQDGYKKEFIYARKQSASHLCVLIFMNPVFCFVGL